MTFLTSKYTSILTIYLIFLSVILELFHFLVPDRTFEVKDFFGNLLGVSVVLIIFLLFKKYAKF